MSITVESSAVSDFWRWSSSTKTILHSPPIKDDAAKDKTYHCFFKALEQFAGDPDTAKEICEVSNTLTKERRVSNNYVIDNSFGVKQIQDMLYILMVADTNTLELLRESVGIPLSINRNKSDSRYTIKGYFRPDFVCKIKEPLSLKERKKPA
ncbi:10675_t:CDS:2, partial [Gigaspora rosea]